MSSALKMATKRRTSFPVGGLQLRLPLVRTMPSLLSNHSMSLAYAIEEKVGPSGCLSSFLNRRVPLRESFEVDHGQSKEGRVALFQTRQRIRLIIANISQEWKALELEVSVNIDLVTYKYVELVPSPRAETYPQSFRVIMHSGTKTQG